MDIPDTEAFLKTYYAPKSGLIETTLCYCKIKPTKPPTAAPSTFPPTRSPTQSPTTAPTQPTLAPTPPPMRPGGFWSGVFGDPHLSTFDRLRFDCQAAGEFTMVTSLETPSFKIQERFTSVGSNACSQASVSTGIAVAEEGIPTVQISIPRGDSAGSEVVGTCPVDLFVGGNLDLLSSGTGSSDVEVSVSGQTISIFYPRSFLEVRATVRTSGSFGCFFLVQVFKPFPYRQNETILGLLGTPNLSRSDDWVAPDGTIYSPPQGQAQSIFSPSYDYCTANWCVRDATNSIFTYKSGESFASFFGCDEDYRNDIESAVDSAGAELRTVCGSDLACLVDGICGGLSDAVAVVQDAEAIVAQQEEDNPLPPSPSPSSSPSDSPSFVPSTWPSSIPSKVPSFVPSLWPSVSPSFFPSVVPSASSRPSTHPTNAPTHIPTVSIRICTMPYGSTACTLDTDCCSGRCERLKSKKSMKKGMMMKSKKKSNYVKVCLPPAQS